ncbi:hypothetical protein [Hyphomonas sp.]|uniref:hypothetical protein n=1 Tax=Hyphomonas sp. TaxID=87 RepID=UPI003002A11D
MIKIHGRWLAARQAGLLRWFSSIYFKRALAGLALAAAPLTAHAQLTVDKLWMDFENNSAGREDVLLRNDSDRRYYISVEPAEIVNAGRDDEMRKEYQNPQDLGLLISPNRLVLEPGQFRALRIVSINDQLSVDRVYRIRVTPKIGAIEVDNAEGDDRDANLVVLMAYDLLVIVRPDGATTQIVPERTQEQITLRNIGNTNILLIDGEACPEGELPRDCVTLPDTRLYAGAAITFDLPEPGARVRFVSRERTHTPPKQISF